MPPTPKKESKRRATGEGGTGKARGYVSGDTPLLLHVSHGAHCCERASMLKLLL